jgi:vacuolar-type H+-ATPase subunit I/STV1
MGAAKTNNVVLDPDAIAEQTGNQGQSSKFKARMASFLKGLGKGVLEYKGEVSINDVKVSKEPFEERLKQTEKQTDELNKTIENNANRNAVVRRILAKYEEKIENNPELASRLDSKAEVIAKVGYVPASQMSHVDKLVEKAREVQGKGPFDL